MPKALKFILLITLVTSISACSAPLRAPHLNAAGELAAPTYAELAAAHNHRVEQLARIQSRGVIEIVWRDEGGARRFRQGDVDLYIDLPRRTALRVTKLGNVYMWLGSDDDRYWLFDLVDEPTLYTGRHAPLVASHPNMLAPANQALAPAQRDDQFHTIQPLALLDLIGLGPLAEFADDDAPQVEYDRPRDAWVVRSIGGGGPVRIFFDRATLLPRRIETLDAAGEVAYYSEIHMNRYRSVPVPGISAATLPRLVGNVDILSTGPDAEARGRVKLVLDAPTGRVDDGAFERVFNFERLIQSLRPTRIEGDFAP